MKTRADWRQNIREAANLLRDTGLSTLRMSANALDMCAPLPGRACCYCKDGHRRELAQQAAVLEALARYAREEETVHADVIDRAWNLVADAAEECERIRAGQDEPQRGAA